jgi:hypothetical protein
MKTPPAFNAFLEQIRMAKYRADQLIELVMPGHEMAEASMAIIWEALFTHLCELQKEPEGLDTSTLNTLAGILQKLMSSFNQLRTLECKLRDTTQEEAQAGSAIQKAQGLTLETIKAIETQFNIL